MTNLYKIMFGNCLVFINELPTRKNDVDRFYKAYINKEIPEPIIYTNNRCIFITI